MDGETSERQSQWLRHSGAGLVSGAGLGMLAGLVFGSVIDGFMIGAGIGLVLGSAYGMSGSKKTS